MKLFIIGYILGIISIFFLIWLIMGWGEFKKLHKLLKEYEM